MKDSAVARLLKYIYRFGIFAGFKAFIVSTKKSGNISIQIPSVKSPVWLRAKTSDIPTFEQIFISQEYDIKIPITPENIIDCGANIGLATVYLKNRYPHAKVISIEPDNGNFAMLQKNTADYNDVHCLKNGVWNKSTELNVVDKLGLGESWALMVDEAKEKNDNSIKSVTIGEIMKQFDLKEIDLLKVDIEGAEKELFSDNYEDWLPKTKVLYIELHDRYRKGTSTSFFKAIINYDFSVRPGRENLICINNKYIQE